MPNASRSNTEIKETNKQKKKNPQKSICQNDKNQEKGGEGEVFNFLGQFYIWYKLNKTDMILMGQTVAITYQGNY